MECAFGVCQAFFEGIVLRFERCVIQQTDNKITEYLCNGDFLCSPFIHHKALGITDIPTDFRPCRQGQHILRYPSTHMDKLALLCCTDSCNLF